MKRRQAIKLLGMTGMSLAGCARSSSAAAPMHSKEDVPKEDKMARIVILHTNDIHGHLLGWRGWEGALKGKFVGGAARLGTAIAQARRDSPDSCMLLDAGDLIGDTMIADLTEGEALIKVFNHLKYDAMTFGNHEPDFGTATLRKRMKEAQLPFVAANLITKDRKEPFAAPYLVKKLQGVSVGILGLAYPKTPWTTAKKNVAEVEFQDPIDAARREISKLQAAGAEVIVVLSHLGLSGDQKLAEAVEGVHVIVGGHSHNRMEQAEKVGNTLIVQAGAHGADLGRLELTLKDGKIASHEHSLIILDHDQIPADEETESLVTEIHAPHEAALNERIGEASGWLVRAQTIAGGEARKRDEESPVDSLFADIVRSELKADIAFLPGVGYGVAIPPGPITASQLRQLVPHEGTLVTMTLSGKEVRDILEQAVENVFTIDSKKKVGGMIQLSGIRFEYDPARDMGERVTHIALEGGELAPDREYTVATNSMLAKGGHNQQTFLDGKRVREHGSPFETVKRWMGSNSPVTAPPLGRIAARSSSGKG
jgi:5'-nucleotidase/UDP-sugar diphosphatase